LISYCLKSTAVGSRKSAVLVAPPFTILDMESIKNVYKQSELLMSGELKEDGNQWHKNVHGEWKLNASVTKSLTEQVNDAYNKVLIKRMKEMMSR
jgi:hypothetical protein